MDFAWSVTDLAASITVFLCTGLFITLSIKRYQKRRKAILEGREYDRQIRAGGVVTMKRPGLYELREINDWHFIRSAIVSVIWVIAFCTSKIAQLNGGDWSYLLWGS